MIPTLHAFLDEWVPRVFADRPAGVAPWFYTYYDELQHPAARLRHARTLALDLKLAGVNPGGGVAVDAGSGFGVTLLCLAELGAEAVGIEAFAPMAASAQVLAARYAPGLSARTLRADVRATPLASDSVDFIYCNEAISHFLEPERFLAEAARVLRPGGKLMICDGNNGANPRTVTGVHEVWRAFEQGPGNRTLHGHRIEVPYRDRRRTMIAAALPGLDDPTLDRLAAGTFGRHGRGVLDAAREALTSGHLPPPPGADDRCPVDPEKGDHIENLVHPHRVRADLERLGFSVRVYAHFGGAKSPVVEAANRVLRALTPLTLRYARSVKVVATAR